MPRSRSSPSINKRAISSNRESGLRSTCAKHGGISTTRAKSAAEGWHEACCSGLRRVLKDLLSWNENMVRLRHRLRVFVAAWLVFQAASFSALVPRDCCSAHRPAAQKCHEPAPVRHCPVQAANKPRCAMHGVTSPATAHHAPAEPSQPERAPANDSACRLTGVCSGPMSALFTLLSNHGVLSDSPSLVFALEVRIVSPAAVENLVGKASSPEPPPPRA